MHPRVCTSVLAAGGGRAGEEGARGVSVCTSVRTCSLQRGLREEAQGGARLQRKEEQDEVCFSVRLHHARLNKRLVCCAWIIK